MNQLDMFEEYAVAVPEVQPQAVRMFIATDEPVEEKAEKATRAILRLFESGKSASVSFSGGKDSSVLMHLTLEAARRALQMGLKPRVVVFSSDTGVENPEVALLLRKEHKKIRAVLSADDIEHLVLLTQPSLASSWAVRILGGNKLPSFPGGSHDCAVDFKVNPIRAARNRVFEDWGRQNTVTLIGTRFDESVERARNMAERGELAEEPYLNDEGELVMSPIAFWSTDDVWELIGLVRAGVIESYSTFDDTFKLYADAGGTSCAVVSDAITEGAKKARGGCGARFGCYVCVAVANDTSLDTMIATDPEYAYMAGLNRLRNLISKTRWDYSKRYWVQRTIDDEGNIKLQPDCYSPAFLLELFRYAASLDFTEVVAARESNHSPRHQLLPVEAVVAIDALWSLNGYHPPHTALLEWNNIMNGHVHYHVPDMSDVPEFPKQPLPPEVPYHVGKTWDGEEFKTLSGSLDVATAMSECRNTKVTKDARVIPLAEEKTPLMSVDVQAFWDAFDMFHEEILERHTNSQDSDWTEGYRFWERIGVLALAPSQRRLNDKFLRRTAWRARHGFLGEVGNLRAQHIASTAQTRDIVAQADLVTAQLQQMLDNLRNFEVPPPLEGHLFEGLAREIIRDAPASATLFDELEELEVLLEDLA
jgi:3'-phosphoadenosine 5'-phosphosulfate sulfotransferase (PAPS reductase)/FAD synthetase